MAKKDASKEITEFVVKRGEQPILSHASEAVARGKIAQSQVNDHNNGVDVAYSLTQRVVSGEGKVTETELEI